MTGEPLIRHLGDESVVLDGDRAYALNPTATAEYDRADGITRRQILARAGAVGAGVGVAMIALPMAEAHASLTAGLQTLTSVSPASGPRGQTITVSGTGFFPNGTITVFTIGGLNVIPSSTTIDSTGAFTVTAVVPNGAGLGANTILVTDNHHNTASNKSYTVVAASVTLTPNTVAKSGSPKSVTVSGSGFLPGDTVTITNTGIDTFTPTPSTLTANGSGLISGSVSLSYGNGNRSGQLTFTDQHGNTASAAISA